MKEIKMVVAIHLVKDFDSYKVSKVIDLSRGAVNDAQLPRLENGSRLPPARPAIHFLKDFEEVVYDEEQKSLGCIALIKQEMNHYRLELQGLRKQWYLEASAENRRIISNKIAINQQWISECEEYISIINQRVLRLQEQLRELSLQNECVNELG